MLGYDHISGVPTLLATRDLYAFESLCQVRKLGIKGRLTLLMFVPCVAFPLQSHQILLQFYLKSTSLNASRSSPTVHRAGKRDAGGFHNIRGNTHDHVIVGSLYWDGLGNRCGSL